MVGEGFPVLRAQIRITPELTGLRRIHLVSLLLCQNSLWELWEVDGIHGLVTCHPIGVDNRDIECAEGAHSFCHKDYSCEVLDSPGTYLRIKRYYEIYKQKH